MWAPTATPETGWDQAGTDSRCREESALRLALLHPALGSSLGWGLPRPWALRRPEEDPRVRLEPWLGSVGPGASASLWLPLPAPPLWLETAINYAV